MKRKYRNTRQKELIEQIINSMNSFFTAEDIHKLTKKKDEDIGIATIYRFLKALKNENMPFQNQSKILMRHCSGGSC